MRGVFDLRDYLLVMMELNLDMRQSGTPPRHILFPTTTNENGVLEHFALILVMTHQSNRSAGKAWVWL